MQDATARERVAARRIEAALGRTPDPMLAARVADLCLRQMQAAQHLFDQLAVGDDGALRCDAAHAATLNDLARDG